MGHATSIGAAAEKELSKLTRTDRILGQKFELLVMAVRSDPYAAVLPDSHKLGFGVFSRRTIWSTGFTHRRVAYRMGWEVVPGEVRILMFGAHEGFYKRLENRI